MTTEYSLLDDQKKRLEKRGNIDIPARVGQINSILKKSSGLFKRESEEKIRQLSNELSQLNQEQRDILDNKIPEIDRKLMFSSESKNIVDTVVASATPAQLRRAVSHLEGGKVTDGYKVDLEAKLYEIIKEQFDGAGGSPGTDKYIDKLKGAGIPEKFFSHLEKQGQSEAMRDILKQIQSDINSGGTAGLFQKTSGRWQSIQRWQDKAMGLTPDEKNIVNEQIRSRIRREFLKADKDDRSAMLSELQRLGFEMDFVAQLKDSDKEKKGDAEREGIENMIEAINPDMGTQFWAHLTPVGVNEYYMNLVPKVIRKIEGRVDKVKLLANLKAKFEDVYDSQTSFDFKERMYSLLTKGGEFPAGSGKQFRGAGISESNLGSLKEKFEKDKKAETLRKVDENIAALGQNIAIAPAAAIDLSANIPALFSDPDRGVITIYNTIKDGKLGEDMVKKNKALKDRVLKIYEDIGARPGRKINMVNNADSATLGGNEKVPDEILHPLEKALAKDRVEWLDLPDDGTLLRVDHADFKSIRAAAEQAHDDSDILKDLKDKIRASFNTFEEASHRVDFVNRAAVNGIPTEIIGDYLFDEDDQVLEASKKLIDELRPIISDHIEIVEEIVEDGRGINPRTYFNSDVYPQLVAGATRTIPAVVTRFLFEEFRKEYLNIEKYEGVADTMDRMETHYVDILIRESLSQKVMKQNPSVLKDPYEEFRAGTGIKPTFITKGIPDFGKLWASVLGSVNNTIDSNSVNPISDHRKRLIATQIYDRVLSEFKAELPNISEINKAQRELEKIERKLKQLKLEAAGDIMSELGKWATVGIPLGMILGPGELGALIGEGVRMLATVLPTVTTLSWIGAVGARFGLNAFSGIREKRNAKKERMKDAVGEQESKQLEVLTNLTELARKRSWGIAKEKRRGFYDKFTREALYSASEKGKETFLAASTMMRQNLTGMGNVNLGRLQTA